VVEMPWDTFLRIAAEGTLMTCTMSQIFYHSALMPQPWQQFMIYRFLKTLNGIHADRVSEFESRFARALKSCVHFFADTEYVRQEMISKLGVSSEKITATPLGVREGMVPLCPLEVKLQLREMKLPEKYLLHVGTIEPRKNLLFLMKEY